MTERERVEEVIKSLNISARQFADEIGIKPGTISNMMVGRNNPSLDVMKKILLKYPRLNPEWLILGTGDMWRKQPGAEGSLFDTLPPEVKARRIPNSTQKEEPATIVETVPAKSIARIVVYYTDNTYEEFHTS